jgi:hypothetical protein
MYMSYSRCEWGGALPFSDITDGITTVIAGSIHSPCRSHGMDLESWFNKDGTRRSLERWQGRRSDVLGS